MKRISFLLFMVMFFNKEIVIAQTLEEEIGFVFVKAEYLFETSRYDDAIIQYNQVINKDPKYKDALIKRAMAKQQLGAFKGAKMDALQYIDLKGITGSAAAILAKAELSLYQTESALNNISAAIGLSPEEAEYYEFRARIYESDGMMIKACADLEKAMMNGSASAEAKARSLCGITKKQKPQPQTQSPVPTPTEVYSGDQTNSGNTEGQTNENSANQTENNGSVSDTTQEGENTNEDVVIEEKEDETIPKPDDFRNILSIDDDLSIELYGQGVGRRGITEVPSILILSDEDGIVSVDFCVNSNGDVTKAEFNASLSTIAKKSLVSLAIRKSKEFIFDKSVYVSQCGVMIFKIKGS
ncbi:MAG: tetratricopeptide repeat protein [Saprospiraceae bacterium]|nr:tetratricopeptide repeat protein [Saprospiraceae bacterium]